jgi:hypothetical protein
MMHAWWNWVDVDGLFGILDVYYQYISSLMFMIMFHNTIGNNIY